MIQCASFLNLITAGKEGMEVTGGDGKVCLVFPILACYIADYPEQCLVTCAKYGMCPRCMSESLGDRGPGPPCTQQDTLATISNAVAATTSEAQFQRFCKENLVSGGVHCPFWEGFPLCDIHLSITPDILHQLYQGVIKHMITWCSSLMDDEELDHRVSTLPPCFGLRHFKGGWSHLCQISGKECKNMACVLLGCLVGKVPNPVITSYRALLDFIYLAQYPMHDDDSLDYIENALNLFHEHKHILINLGVREYLDVPKFHSMPWFIMWNQSRILVRQITTTWKCLSISISIWPRMAGKPQTSGMRYHKWLAGSLNRKRFLSFNAMSRMW